MSYLIQDKKMKFTDTGLLVTVSNWQRSGHSTHTSGSDSLEKKGSFEAFTGCTFTPACQQCSPAAEQQEDKHCPSATHTYTHNPKHNLLVQWEGKQH